MLFFWMLNIAVRTRLAELRQRRAEILRQERELATAGTPAMEGDVVRLH
jgi:hypothetical protein